MTVDYTELDQLLSRYFEGDVSAAELATLEARLLADDAFVEHFSRWCLMHRQVTELITEDKLHALMDQFAVGSPTLPKKFFAESATSASNRREAVVAGLKLRWALAVLLAAVACMPAIWWLASRQNEIASPGAPSNSAAVAAVPANETDAAGKIIATLTQVVDGVWAPGAPVLHHGQLLLQGDRVALASGMVKITYDCGAEVVLEGPCEFSLQGPMVGYLTSGRITANVPRRAFTFAILSPHVDMVDLGTSFGVDIGANGRTELHVFEGEVLCSETSSEPAPGRTRTSPVGPAAGERTFRLEPTPALIHVTADNAMEFSGAPSRPSDIAMNRDQFSRLIALRRAADVEAGHLTEDKLALWLAADVAVTTDPQGRLISWQDIVYGDNESGEDAMQVEENARPSLVPNAVNGRPAVRFDGDSDYLLTTPLETTDDQTVLFVCQFSDTAFDKSRKWGGQIINYDGPPSRYLSNTLEPGVLQIGEPLLESEFKPTLLTGQVFAGFVGSAVVEAGRVDAEPVGPNVPVLVSYVYDYTAGKSRLAINGRTYGEARAFAPQGITSRKVIGRHAWMDLYFHGDLAEMLIFNKALTPEELADTTTYLADKYAIQLAPEAQAASTEETH